MTCGFSKYELYIIWKLCHRNTWCKKHVDRRDLVKGRPKHEIDLYDDAIRSLVRGMFITEYRSQGRSDICIPKQNRNKALVALKSHQDEYEFIKNLEYIT
ncbi:Uncharacterised protein [uncultured archaeon]|nr:Uncharacterised protein [uncultured archaeon]